MAEDITMPGNPDTCYASPTLERFRIVPAVAIQVLPS